MLLCIILLPTVNHLNINIGTTKNIIFNYNPIIDIYVI